MRCTSILALVLTLAAPVSAAEPALLDAMRHALGWQRPEASSQEHQALDAALKRLVETPTGEALAREFVAEGARAIVEFADLPGTLAEHQGKLELVGEVATTNDRAQPPHVKLNRLFLREHPSLRDADLSSTLAHELFGHALEVQRATRAGIPFHVHSFIWDDELISRLIGWQVRLELSSPLPDLSMEEYLRDPAIYMRDSYIQSNRYAVALTRAEMRDPLGAVRTRIAVVDAARDGNEARRDDSYRTLMRERIAGAREAIGRQIEMWLHGDEAIKDLADHAYFVGLEARVARRAVELRTRATSPALSRPVSATKRP